MTETLKDPVSRNTLSKADRLASDPVTAAPRAVSVDKYAQRKDRVYV
ncbi:hypothetical protein [Streptomyces lincolnensis]